MNSRHLTFLVLFAANTALAQSIGADFFPLALGNNWTYRYLAIDDDTDDVRGRSDSGTASYTVVTREATVDSVVWGIREARDVVEKTYSYWMGYTEFSRVPIKDTVLFSVVEYLDGSHRIVRAGKAENCWQSVFCVMARTSDTTSVFRYVPDAQSDTVQYTTSWRRWDTPASSLTDAVGWTLQRGIGIRSVDYSTPGIVGSAYRTRHRLVSQTILSVRPNETPMGPSDFLLENNYPNPFNPRTVLCFSVGSRERVTLTIVDILGRPRATLLDEIVEAGKHSVIWHAIGEASGTYFCVAKTSHITRSMKLVLLK